MKTLARAFLIGSIAATSLVAAPAWADAPTAEAEREASERFQRGVDFFREGDFRAALIEFRRAHELAPNYRVLFNIGQTALALQDYAQSLDAFEKYLAQGGSEVPAERRAQVEGDVKRLLGRVATVAVKVNVPNATIMVDDIVVGTSPLDHPLRVGAGRHKISAATSEGVPDTRAVEIAGGETMTITLELVASTRSRSQQPAGAPSPQVEAPPSNTPIWVGLGVTTALAIGTGVMGIVVANKKSSFDKEVGRYTPEGNLDAIDAARSSAERSALVFDVLAVATVVAGGTTLFLALSRSSSGKTANTVRMPRLQGLLQGSF